MKQTIKQLTEKLTKVQECFDDLKNANVAQRVIIRELNEENSKLNTNQERLLIECNQRAELIKNILTIILGEAESESKYQVIRDLFLEQVKKHEEYKKNYNPHLNYGQGHLSDKIDERSLG